jgi:hypothetical protein
METGFILITFWDFNRYRLSQFRNDLMEVQPERTRGWPRLVYRYRLFVHDVCKSSISDANHNHPKARRPVADAKEVEVGNPAEETFCHRTMFFSHSPPPAANLSLSFACPFLTYNIIDLRQVTTKHFRAVEFPALKKRCAAPCKVFRAPA